MKLEWIVDRRGEAGPVIDQGDRPTCLSCAVSSAHGELDGESKSVEFLHYTCRSKHLGTGAFESIADVLADEGQPPEDQWPYDPTIEDSLAVPPATVVGPFAHAVVSMNATSDTPRLISALQGGVMPIIGLVTTRRFMLLKRAILTEPDTHLNRHAVLLVGAAIYKGRDVPGLTDGDTLMCVQNSWGRSWGVDGFGLIGPRAWGDMLLVSAVLGGP